MSTATPPWWPSAADKERADRAHAETMARRAAAYDSPPASCEVCNDEGVVHAMDGRELGPCDCALPADQAERPAGAARLRAQIAGLTVARIIVDGTLDSREVCESLRVQALAALEEAITSAAFLSAAITDELEHGEAA